MSKIVEIARQEIGTIEEPPNSNKTKYGVWFGLNGVAWCAIFVSWCYAMADEKLPNIGFKKGFAGCQTGHAYFKKMGWITDKPVAGDIVLYDWNGDGRFDHTGIFVEWITNISFSAIEGNTAVGNDSNGGKVMLRTDRTKQKAIFVHVPQ